MFHPCISNDCDKVATWRFLWAGKYVHMCNTCKERAEGISRTMGVALDCRLIRTNDSTEE